MGELKGMKLMICWQELALDISMWYVEDRCRIDSQRLLNRPPLILEVCIGRNHSEHVLQDLSGYRCGEPLQENKSSCDIRQDYSQDTHVKG
jgi:hypothetical protein